MSAGTLIIAGGALDRAALNVFTRFVHAAGGPGRRFAVLPAATADPAGAFDLAARLLSTVGVAAGQVVSLPVSGKVAGWEGGASDAAVLDEVARADGIWIPGGDQNAITRLLLKPDGSDTPLLAALRRRLEAGAAIGGTSAGAAVMSDPMIGAGTSLGALSLPRSTTAADTEISDALHVSRGLGLFPYGIVDQHFDSRARLGRLIEAAMVEDGARRLAFGIAEDSAMIYDHGTESAEVVGSGGLSVVDVRNATRDGAGARKRIQDVLLHYLTPGDTIDLRSGRIETVGKTPIAAGDWNYSMHGPVACGVLSPYGRLADFAGAMLMDNDPSGLAFDETHGLRFVRSLLAASLDPSLDAGSPAWEIRLGRKDGSSRAWYGAGIGFEGVVVDLLPVRLGLHYL